MPQAIPIIAAGAASAAGASATTAAVVGGVASAGVAAYGQYSAGREASGVANANATQQMFGGRLEAGHARIQALQKFYQSQSNALELSTSARIGRANAKNLRRTARAEGDYTRENIRRQRIMNDHFLGAQRARYGVSGVGVNTGTPVAVLAETAAAMELEVQDMVQASENRARNLYTQANQADFGARRDEIAARSERKLGQLSFDYDTYVAGLNLGFANQRASITRQVGAARAKAYRNEAIGTAISGAAKAYGQYQDYKDKGAWGGGRAPAASSYVPKNEWVNAAKGIYG
jgi:hypothetical protein